MKYFQQSIFASLLFLILSSTQSIAQTEIRAVEFGTSYTVYDRPGLDEYFKTFADSADLTSMLASTPSYGIHLRYLVRKDKVEIDGGLVYSFSLNNAQSATGGSVNSKTHDIGFIFGVNYVPVPIFFIGGQIIVNSFGGGTDLFDPLPTSITNNMGFPPDGDLNIFKGYSIIGRAQAGFNIHFSPESGNGMRLFGYYDIGSSYDFYNSLDEILEGYTGDPKTNTSGYGVGLLFYIGRII